MARKKLGDLLCEAGVLDEAQLAAALGHQRQWGGRLGSVLVQLNLIGEKALLDALSRQLALPTVTLGNVVVPVDVLTMVPREMCEEHLLLPWALTRNEKGVETLHVAMSDPTNLAVIDELAFRTGKRVQVEVASDRDVELAIRRYFYGERIEDQLARLHPPTVPAFAGQELELPGGEEPALEVEEGARERIAHEVRAPGPAAPAQGPTLAEPNTVYGGIERTPSQPISAQPLRLRERMLVQTLEAELGVEGLSDRDMLLALARLLIRKGVISENEWIEELARR